MESFSASSRRSRARRRSAVPAVAPLSVPLLSDPSKGDALCSAHRAWRSRATALFEGPCPVGLDYFPRAGRSMRTGLGSMTALVALARIEAGLVLGLLVLMIVLLALGGRIHFAGLLENKATGQFDPARLQLLVTTLLLAGLMLTGLGEMRTRKRISVPSDVLVLVAGGSHGLYLFRKYRQTFPRKGRI
jgi:hypothetical protein